MCTLALSVRPSPRIALVVAANRDEALDRPSDPPMLWEGREPRVLAPRDRIGGGSWLGLNEHGLFVAITNRFGGAKDPTRVSRGLLVLDALSAPSAGALHERLSSEDVARYSPFHLAYADSRAAYVTAWTGEARLQQVLAPGMHVFTERSFGAADDSQRVAHFRQGWPEGGALGELPALLSAHDPEAPFDAPCVHAPAFNYGTRSSFVLELSETVGASRLLYTEGRPCESAFLSGDALLRALGR